MGKLFNRGREKRKREEKVKVGKLFKDGEKKRGKEKLEVGRLFKEGGKEKRKKKKKRGRRKRGRTTNI